MPREETKLDDDLILEVMGEGQKSTKKIKDKYLEESDRDSLNHRTMKKNLERLEEEEGRVSSFRPEDVNLILWRSEE